MQLCALCSLKLCITFLNLASFSSIALGSFFLFSYYSTFLSFGLGGSSIKAVGVGIGFGGVVVVGYNAAIS